MSRVDVTIPCYNYGRFLGQCVASVLTQSHRDVRVVIVDDASTDHSFEIAERLAASDARVEIVRHEVNRGHIATYNECIELADGDYMLILSADDFLLPGALARAVAVLDGDPEVGFAPGDWVHHRKGDQLPDSADVPPNAEPLAAGAFVEQLAVRNKIGTATAIVRTAVQKRIGGYRDDLPHSADLEMWVRFALEAKIAYLHAPQAAYRRHGGNMSTRYGRRADLEQCIAAFKPHYRAIRERLPDGGAVEARIRELLEARAQMIERGTRNRGGAAAEPTKSASPGSAARHPPATAVIILNWKRPQNIGAIVRTASEALPQASIFVIDQGEGADSLAGRDEVPRDLCSILSQDNRGPGVRIKFAAEWPFDHYLCIDDDMFLTAGQMRALMAKLADEPDRVHGMIGQLFTRYANGDYAVREPVKRAGEISVLNRVYAFTRERARSTLTLARLMNYGDWGEVKRTDDVLLSAAGPSPPMVHDLGRFEQCPTRGVEGIAVSRTPGFHEERRALMRRLIARGLVYFKDRPDREIRFEQPAEAGLGAGEAEVAVRG